MIRSLKIDADKLEKSRKLIEGMANLKEMRLLSGRDFNRTQFPGIIKHEHIYNDYHQKSSNPGYSRNPMGGKIFTKWGKIREMKIYLYLADSLLA